MRISNPHKGALRHWYDKPERIRKLNIPRGPKAPIPDFPPLCLYTQQYTFEFDCRLLDMLRARKTYREIADELGLTLNTIAGRLATIRRAAAREASCDKSATGSSKMRTIRHSIGK
jgi:ParB-like chromosome segregation protein Spo0J